VLGAENGRQPRGSVRGRHRRQPIGDVPQIAVD